MMEIQKLFSGSNSVQFSKFNLTHRQTLLLYGAAGPVPHGRALKKQGVDGRGGTDASSAARTGWVDRWLANALSVIRGMGGMTPTPQAQSNKVFLLLFVHKKKALILAFAAA
jgi:hypothetical protein